ncbi:VCBS repeat-containing protein [Hydrogenovibrio crunogenus]|uniref:VCBS repeat-containing protein n=1 Tax=Hydrogenovibrio crunogenus TaxID=39765 RepID=A0A4P7P198_9GAMM|nr:hypothetical protein [Hydrogenovibrio crunogenus]QBZ83941.1 VCBS repeat-containing protein [Hydrogenovibrio crunogenus]
MIIQSSAVRLQQQHQYDSSFSQKQSLMVGEAVRPQLLTNSDQRVEYQQSERFDYSHRKQRQFESTSQVTQGQQETVLKQTQVIHELAQLSLTGESALVASQKAFPANDKASIEVSGEVSFDLNHQLHLKTASFSAMSATGQVLLNDGRSIDFKLVTSHSAKTEVMAESKASLSVASMQDPLVINFGTESVTLNDQFFEFDIQGNGEQHHFAQLGAGSGFLVFDENQDGQVNDGSELFGAQSGQAFADLAIFDADGNGWIDEADPIFQHLKLWTDQSNESHLVSLASKGVGAIYLGHAEQEEDLMGSQGEKLGHVKSAGIVLMENGAVQTAQAIDLAERQAFQPSKSDSHTFFSASQQQAIKDFSEAMNSLQQIKSERASEAISLERPFASLGKGREAAQDAKQFFEQLREQIQKMIEQRKAILDRIQQRYSA